MSLQKQMYETCTLNSVMMITWHRSHRYRPRRNHPQCGCICDVFIISILFYSPGAERVEPGLLYKVFFTLDFGTQLSLFLETA